jgi:signal recognition particle receptor subunit beta
MVELNHRERSIKVKIVYYGPPIGGKTTNLQVLHQYALAARRGELVSINSAQDRTILFDLLPIRAAGFRGFELKLQVLAVPGQAMYAATRRLVLKGADSLVFVANSAADRWEENIQSFREMTQNLLAHQLDPAAMPLVLQYNKRDLPEVTPVEFMDRTLNARNVDAVSAIAVRGEGVLETFSAILYRTMQDLAQRYQIIETKRGQTIQQWTQQAVIGIFGTTSLAPEPNPLPAETAPSPPAGVAPPSPPAEAPAPERRTVKVALPEDAVKMGAAGPDARANETLVESYAQASAQLSTALDDVREERDVVRRRLEDLQHILHYAQEFVAGQPQEATFRGILARMADSVGGTHASLVTSLADGSLRATALRGGLSVDPLLHVPAGARHVKARFLSETEPHVHQAADSLDLGDALDSQEPRFGAVTVVPIRTPRGLLALAMLYHTADAALPRPDMLAHLAMLSRAISSSLELTAARETLVQAERAVQLSVSGTASVHGLQEILRFLEVLRGSFGTIRRRPDTPPAVSQEFVSLAPGLAGALSTARALLSFSRGEIEKEAVALQDLLGELRGPGVSVEVTPEVPSVLGSAPLLRLALRALVELIQGPSRPGGLTPVQIEATVQGGRIRVTVAGPTPSSPAGAPLGLARRVAEQHGGTLTVQGEGPGRYSISFTLA